VIREALRELFYRETIGSKTLGNLREALETGCRAADRGELWEWPHGVTNELKTLARGRLLTSVGELNLRHQNVPKPILHQAQAHQEAPRSQYCGSSPALCISHESGALSLRSYPFQPRAP